MSSGVPRWVLVVAGVGALFVLLPLAAMVVRVDWADFLALITSPSSVDALLLSLRTSLIATAACLLLGVPMAVVLARVPFRGRGLLRAVVLLPLVLPPVVGGFRVFPDPAYIPRTPAEGCSRWHPAVHGDQETRRPLTASPLDVTERSGGTWLANHSHWRFSGRAPAHRGRTPRTGRTGRLSRLAGLVAGLTGARAAVRRPEDHMADPRPRDTGHEPRHNRIALQPGRRCRRCRLGGRRRRGRLRGRGGRFGRRRLFDWFGAILLIGSGTAAAHAVRAAAPRPP